MYRFLKHTADVMFEVDASSLDELFEDAGKAVMATMVELKTVKPKTKMTIELKANKLEDLLYNFLSELVYLKDSKFMVFSEIRAVVDVLYEGEDSNEKFPFTVNAEIRGDKIDAVKQKLGVDVKAITMHMFTVEKKLLGKASEKKKRYKWYAKVILDV